MNDERSPHIDAADSAARPRPHGELGSPEVPEPGLVWEGDEPAPGAQPTQPPTPRPVRVAALFSFLLPVLALNITIPMGHQSFYDVEPFDGEAPLAFFFGPVGGVFTLLLQAFIMFAPPVLMLCGALLGASALARGHSKLLPLLGIVIASAYLLGVAEWPQLLVGFIG